MLPMKELRINENDGSAVIEGHAAVFDSWSETLGGIFPFKEIVRKGAFNESIGKTIFARFSITTRTMSWDETEQEHSNSSRMKSGFVCEFHRPRRVGRETCRRAYAAETSARCPSGS